MKNLLLHVCCGVCACGFISKLKEQGYKITGYFYNPNIHPFQEFQKRLRAVEVFAEQEKMTVIYERDYGLDEYLRDCFVPRCNIGGLAMTVGERCARCYEMRLTKTADYAKENGFDEFTSTLIVSPQQNQAVIRNIGENIAKTKGIIFKYDSVTELYPQCKAEAKKRQLYRQQYCGCIFSEYERYGRVNH